MLEYSLCPIKARFLYHQTRSYIDYIVKQKNSKFPFRSYKLSIKYSIKISFKVDIVNNITKTRGSVRIRGIRLALVLREKGITLDDIVVICCSNQADQTIVVLATLFLGAIVAPLDPFFDFKDACQLVKKLKPKLIFTDTRTSSQIERILITLNLNVPLINLGRSASSSNLVTLGSMEDNNFKPVFIEDPRMSVAFIMPTQGTTGPPKLVCLSHHNIFIETLIVIDIFDNPDKVLSFFPISLLFQTILVCVTFESTTTIFYPGTFSERNACKFISDYQISHATFGTDYAIKVVHSFALKVSLTISKGTVSVTNTPAIP